MSIIGLLLLLKMCFQVQNVVPGVLLSFVLNPDYVIVLTQGWAGNFY